MNGASQKDIIRLEEDIEAVSNDTLDIREICMDSQLMIADLSDKVNEIYENYVTIDFLEMRLGSLHSDVKLILKKLT